MIELLLIIWFAFQWGFRMERRRVGKKDYQETFCQSKCSRRGQFRNRGACVCFEQALSKVPHLKFE
jgi:hypothetical protein